MSRIVVSAALMGGIVLAAPAPSPADQTTLRAELETLFELGWSLRTRAEALAHYQRLKAAEPGDWRVRYAFALVEMKQRRPSNAAKVLDELADRDTPAILPVQTKAWLAAMRGKGEAALSALERVAELLPSEEEAGAAEQQYREVVAFLGRMMGYLAGPGADSVPAELLDKTQRRIVGRLSLSRQEAFYRSRAETLQRFEDLVKKSEATKVEAIEQAKLQRERVLAELERRGAEAQNDFREARRQLALFEKNHAEELKQLGDAERRAMNVAEQAHRRSIAARQDAAVIEGRISDLLEAAEDPGIDPVERRRLLDRAAGWELTLNRVIADIARADADLRAADSELSRIQSEKGALDVQHRAVLGGVENVDKLLRAIDNERTKVIRAPVNGNTGPVRSLEQKSGAVSTYVSFSVEAARDRLLETFR